METKPIPRLKIINPDYFFDVLITIEGIHRGCELTKGYFGIERAKTSLDLVARASISFLPSGLSDGIVDGVLA